MNSEPCVKFGIRISPKIREKPADRRNSSPPKVTLFTVSTSQKVIAADIPRSKRQIIRRRLIRRLRRCSSLRFERWIVARVDGLLEELLFVVGPELTHVMVCLDRLVDQLAVRLFEMADVEVADHVAEVVELDRAARRVSERYRLHRRHECGLVIRLSASLLQAGLDHHPVDVESRAVETGVDAIVLVHGGDKALVARRVEIKRIGTAAIKPKRIVAERTQKRVVASGFPGYDRKFQTGRGVLLEEAQRV